ncbi:MAG: hypothetical protein HYS39_03140 [Proteobacteria bacterium]|nr:hypothetical protein [Pseudomonadota bacterium]
MALGGCPYAKGAKGNVSTEEVVLLLQAKGYKIAIDLEALQNAHQTLQRIKNYL